MWGTQGDTEGFAVVLVGFLGVLGVFRSSLGCVTTFALLAMSGLVYIHAHARASQANFNEFHSSTGNQF